MSEQKKGKSRGRRFGISTGADASARDRDGAFSRVTGKFNRSTILMSLMFAVGLGWVIWESQQITEPTDTDEDFTTEVVVDSGIEAMARQVKGEAQKDTQTAEMVESFYYDPRQRQIAASALRQNPFGVKEEIVELTTTTTINPEPEKPKAPPIKNLTLQSVVLSSPPSAMISGAIVTEGQIINKWKIVKIERRRVTLRWQDETHILRMADD